jgi:D-glycero-D-manno-heptose 1,7-bisphosphate phosphatase
VLGDMMAQIELGLWCQIDTPGLEGRPALFLDRDGVIIRDTHYLGRPEEVCVIEGAASAISRCNALGIPIVIVTNQSGIGRGFYGWDEFRAVQAALCTALTMVGAKFDAVMACAYHADALEPFRIENHPWRKPNPGMILEAGNRMKLDLSRSWIVGDRSDDIAAGQAARLRGGVLIATGHHEQLKQWAYDNRDFKVSTAPNLAAAVAALVEDNRLYGPAG